MKKIVLIIVMLCSLQGITQTTDSIKYAYCEISYVIIPKGQTPKVVVSIDYGKNKPLYIIDESDKFKEFTNIIDALNYMGYKGWEVTSFVIEQTLIGVPAYRYLLKKKL